MARKEEFEIIVTPDGEIKIVALGFKGTGCMKQLKEVGEIVSPGNAPIGEDKFPEYYQQVEDEGKIKGEIKD
ncbi:MAG: hypothetical protein ABIG42_10620 [bacterium]